MKRAHLLFSAALITGALASQGNAQVVLDQAYARGVHAYFAGQTDRAIEWLDQALDADSKDPRVLYFHGLAMIQQSGGSIDAGIGDFEEAANLEINAGRVVDVGRALERIQGATRQEIEDIRLRVRVANKDKLPRPPLVPSNPQDLGPEADPFGGPGGMTGGAPTPMPSRSVVPRPTPAPTAPVPAPNPIEPDTFGTPVTPPAENPFGASAPEENPFGGSDATTNPFGDDF